MFYLSGLYVNCFLFFRNELPLPAALLFRRVVPVVVVGVGKDLPARALPGVIFNGKIGILIDELAALKLAFNNSIDLFLLCLPIALP